MNFSVFSGTRARGTRTQPKGDHNEGHFESFEQDRLVREQKPEEVKTGRRRFDLAASAEFRPGFLVNGLLIVSCFQTSIAHDRILQPLQTKEEEKRADDRAKDIKRNPLDKCGPQSCHK